MILYLDSSSLAKLYIEETHSDLVHEWVDGAEVVVTCRVAYPEVISALTRRYKTGDLSKKNFELLTQAFRREWGEFTALDFDERAAGHLVNQYGLRGFDAIHLASAKGMKAKHKGILLSFSSFDHKLNQAAKAEGLEVLTA